MVSHHITIQNASNYEGNLLNSQSVQTLKNINLCHKNTASPETWWIRFRTVTKKTNNILLIDIIVAYKGYDAEKNHVAASDLGITRIIPPRYADVPVYKTRGYHRKRLKRNGYDDVIYHQRNKCETIFYVIKKMFGENVTSRKILTQNRELLYRIIAYNSYRITRNNSLI